MKRFLQVPAMLAVTVAAAIAATGMAPAAQPPAARPPATLSSIKQPTVAAGAAGRTLLLINGDTFAVSAAPAAGSTAPQLIRLPGGPPGGLLGLGVGGKSYEIPADALPYLGRGLDPGLFQPSALLGAEQDGRIPVVVRAGGQAPSLPGITITSQAGGAATGYLTAASARTFGAALARQYAADHAGGSYGLDGIFGTGTSISLAGSPATAARQAQAAVPVPQAPPPAAGGGGFKLSTLTVRGTNLAGHADTGDEVIVFNMDNTGLFGDPVESTQAFVGGIAKFSVPQGHYFAAGVFTDMSGGQPSAFRMTVLPQFTVSGDTTVATDERAASSEISAVTPRPADVVDGGIDLFRNPAAGFGITEQFGAAGMPVWVSPTTTPPTAGTLQADTGMDLASPAGASQRYAYSLAFQGPNGIIPDQHRVVSAASLTTITGSYFGMAGTAGSAITSAVFPEQLSTFAGPLTGTEFDLTGPGPLPPLYVTAGPTLQWRSDLFEPSITPLFVQNDQRTYRPGEQATQNWGEFPLHPAPVADVPGAAVDNLLPASASRTGNEVTLAVNPFTDNTVGHAGDYPITGQYEIDQNGTKVAGGTVSSFGLVVGQAALSQAPSVVRFALDVTRSATLSASGQTGAAFPLSAQTDTVWTWKSAPPAASATLPADWICGGALADDLTTHCSAEPLLSLNYQVAGLRPDGSVAAGKQQLTLTVTHFEPSTSTAKITSVKVQVSFDGGKTFTDAAVTGSGAAFTAAYTAPVTAKVAELRVSAADAAGSTVTETLPAAYQIAS